MHAPSALETRMQHSYVHTCTKTDKRIHPSSCAARKMWKKAANNSCFDIKALMCPKASPNITTADALAAHSISRFCFVISTHPYEQRAKRMKVPTKPVLYCISHKCNANCISTFFSKENSIDFLMRLNIFIIIHELPIRKLILENGFLFEEEKSPFGMQWKIDLSSWMVRVV